MIWGNPIFEKEGWLIESRDQKFKESSMMKNMILLTVW